MAAATLGLLSACVSAPSLPTIARGEAVTIVATPDLRQAGPIEIQNQAIGTGVSVGVGSGLVAGGLWGLACGPFAVLCVPLGAALGVATGGAAGALVGLTGALPGDKAEQLRARMARVQQSHGLMAELQKNVADRAGKYWTVAEGASATVLRLELLDLQLSSTRDEQVRCAVRVLVTARTAGAAPAPAHSGKLYEYIGAYSSLAVWLDEGSDFADTSLSIASQQIATQIVSDLAPH